MRRVLIIGENSYIGKSFERYTKNRYDIKIVNSRNDAWKNINFAGYDSVLHCAGIAHVSHNPKMEALYYEVNCDLTVNVATKAKEENVRQFIFLSSILIYGSNKADIDGMTLPNPDNSYSKSKLKAEQELGRLAEQNFKLCIIRAPMVYGKGCKGNFPRLVKLAKITPFFPDYPNKRSMIYIDNLCEFICSLVDDQYGGVFLPQNDEYFNTTALVHDIAEFHNRRITRIRLFNVIIRTFVQRVSILKKMFGDLYYIKSGNESGYNIVSSKESINRSVE